MKKKGTVTHTEKHFETLKAEMEQHKTPAEHVADFLTRSFGTVFFFNLNAGFFFIWIVVNLGFVPFLEPFDPFPFGLLTMVVSLEAIFLSVIVLISQNRASDIADLREELDLKINIRSEEEANRLIEMVGEIHQRLGIKSKQDPNSLRLAKKINVGKMRDSLIKEMKDSN